MPGMNHPARSEGSGSLGEVIEHHATSGTDAQPASTPTDMLMKNWHGWMWMFHGEAFLNDVQQSGPRAADKRERQPKGLSSRAHRATMPSRSLRTNRTPEGVTPLTVTVTL